MALIKIAFVAIKGFQTAGGIEKYTEEIGSRLVKRGHKVIVYSSRNYATKKNGIHEGMDVKTLPCLKSKSLEKISLSFLASLHQFMERDVDIVHFHAVGPSMFSFLPRLFTERKVVIQ